jgi:hypothetical protein
MHYLQIDIGDLETLVTIQGLLPAKFLLRRWRDEYPSDPKDFGVFLNGVRAENGLDARMPLLDQRMADFAMTQFGATYPPLNPDKS